jgi:protein arginine N-methyltransferase 2
MGIVDAAIARRRPRLQVICEAHAAIQERAVEFAARCDATRDGGSGGGGDTGGERRCVVVRGRWQSAGAQAELEALGPFDGVFFDTYEETVEDFLELLLLRLLRPRGRFSFCNMYQPHDAVRHVAYSAYLQARLARLGLTCSFERLEVPVPPETWRGLQLNYWPHASYLLPRCRRPEAAAETRPHRPLKRRRSAEADDSLPPTLEPLDALLWSAKHWACRSATCVVCADDGGGGTEPPLSVVWDTCEPLFGGSVCL